MKIPKVSVIVPVHNGEKYIKSCYESLKNQTLQEIEIIFVNDGSKDRSKKILDSLAEKDRKIKVIHQENSGPGVARNEGIKAAAGEYLGFVDVDDIPRARMYETMYLKAEEGASDIVVCGFRVLNKKKEIKEEVVPNFYKDHYCGKYEIREKILQKLILENPVIFSSMCNKIYKRSIIERDRLKSEEKIKFGEDLLFNLNLLGNIQKISFLKKSLYEYIRSNPKSLSSIYLENAFELFLYLRRFWLQKIEEWELDKESNLLIYNTNFLNFIFYERVIVNEMDKRNEKNILKKYNNIKNYLESCEIKDAMNFCDKKKLKKVLKEGVFKVFLMAYFDGRIRPILSRVKKNILNKIFLNDLLLL